MNPRTPTSRRQVLASLGALALGQRALGQASTSSATEAGSSRARKLIASARQQIGVTLRYDSAYTRIPFPNGDVPRAIGVCTDVVIRAYRDALAVDLQSRVHDDMRRAFAAYPSRWGLKSPDSNIDHRRVPNLQTFWRRERAALKPPPNESGWQPGDIVTSLIGGRLPHVGIVSDRRAASTRYLVIHNIGGGTQEEDALFSHPITGRYRWLVD